MFYIEIIGPMDGVYVGPFGSKFAAERHIDALRQRHGSILFDFHVMDRGDVADAMEQFGVLPIQSPDSWPTV